MKSFYLLVVIYTLIFTSQVMADVYKCTKPDGTVLYTTEPCVDYEIEQLPGARLPMLALVQIRQSARTTARPSHILKPLSLQPTTDSDQERAMQYLTAEQEAQRIREERTKRIKRQIGQGLYHDRQRGQWCSQIGARSHCW